MTGISPVAAQEICYLAGLDSDLPPSELSEDLMTHLYRQFTLFLDQVRQEDFHPAIYNRNNEPYEFSSVPLTHLTGCSHQDYRTISEVLSSYYAVKNRITRIRQKSADLRHIVQTALERNRKNMISRPASFRIHKSVRPTRSTVNFSRPTAIRQIRNPKN